MTRLLTQYMHIELQGCQQPTYQTNNISDAMHVHVHVTTGLSTTYTSQTNYLLHRITRLSTTYISQTKT